MSQEFCQIENFKTVEFGWLNFCECGIDSTFPIRVWRSPQIEFKIWQIDNSNKVVQILFGAQTETRCATLFLHLLTMYSTIWVGLKTVGQGLACRIELLTKAKYLLSGDHDGTLIVPWPPYK
ncbi:hypothetical protein BH10BAC4_BH10BAC4_26840 [soil metagenome]